MPAFVLSGLVSTVQAKTLVEKNISTKWPTLCRVGRKTLPTPHSFRWNTDPNSWCWQMATVWPIMWSTCTWHNRVAAVCRPVVHKL